MFFVPSTICPLPEERSEGPRLEGRTTSLAACWPPLPRLRYFSLSLLVNRALPRPVPMVSTPRPGNEGYAPGDMDRVGPAGP